MPMPQPQLVNPSHGREDLTAPYIFPNCAPAVAFFTRRGIQDPAEMLAAMQACRKAMVSEPTPEMVKPVVTSVSSS